MLKNRDPEALHKVKPGHNGPEYKETLERVYAYFKNFLQREEGTTAWDWTDNHKEVFKNFIWYLNNDAAKCKWDIDKGVILSGPNGTGKSTFMQFFSELSRQMYVRGSKKRFSFVECRMITDNIEASGDVSFLHNFYRDKENSSVAFNEIGKEKYINNFGNKIYPIEQILINRFDKRLLVFGTTNLTHGDTGDLSVFHKYGSDLDSRFNLCNYIHLTGDKASDGYFRDYRKK